MARVVIRRLRSWPRKWRILLTVVLAAGVSLMTTHACKQSFLQQVLGNGCISDADQRIAVEIVTVRIQPLARIESVLCVDGDLQCRLRCL